MRLLDYSIDASGTHLTVRFTFPPMAGHPDQATPRIVDLHFCNGDNIFSPTGRLRASREAQIPGHLLPQLAESRFLALLRDRNVDTRAELIQALNFLTANPDLQAGG